VTDVLMPRLSDSMEQGTILTWLVQDGGEVAEGQELAEIETDKATMTYEAEAAGTLAVVAAEGTTVAVGEVIARVGESAASEGVAAQASPAAEAVPAADVAEPGAATNGSGAGHHPTALLALDAQVAATPMARRIAARHDVSLRSLQGTGPRGRIVRADVLRAAGSPPRPRGRLVLRRTRVHPGVPDPGPPHRPRRSRATPPSSPRGCRR
jgi:pyruvate dehydrogenase E2 component (dihydrolipoyllysine-residue acetyltransferase)